MRRVTLNALAQVTDPIVRAALEEIQRASADSEINDVGTGGGALAALVGEADTVPYFTAPDAAELTALTAYARTLIAATDAAAAQTVLGLGGSLSFPLSVDLGGTGSDLTATGGPSKFLAQELTGAAVTVRRPDASDITYTNADAGAVAGVVNEKLDRFPTPYDFGAVGDGDTDDTTALQAWLDVGGMLYLSNGGYKITTALVADETVTIYGAGRDNSVIFVADGSDCKVLTLNGTDSSVYNVGFIGSQAFTATNANVTLAQGTNNCHVEHCFFQYGKYPYLNLGTDNTFISNEVRYGYGSANVKTAAGSGNFFIRNKMDQAWPISNPDLDTGVSGWAANTTYNVSDVVSATAPGGADWLIQCIAVTGDQKSGGSQPTLLGYEQSIVDNHVTWNIACPLPYYSFQMDSGASEIFLFMNDHSGAFTDCIAMTDDDNDFSGPDPFLLWVQNSICGQQSNRAVVCNVGNNVSILNCELNQGWYTSDAEMVATQAEFGGQLEVSHNRMAGGNNNIDGIKLYGDFSNIMVSNNRCTGVLDSFVRVDTGAGNITDFTITDNQTEGSSIQIASGADWFIVTGNNTGGGGVNDSSGGSNKVVDNNI